MSKYPEALIVSNTGAKDNIRALEEIFGRHRYPEEMITDNGPPWNGNDTHAMKQYLEWAGVKHKPTRSADDPEANGLAERFMQTLEKSWETAVVDNINPLAALNKLLKTYRNTEHSVTKRKPAEWLFGRPIRMRIPDIKLQTQRDDEESQKAKENIRNQASKEKERHDKTAREEHLEVGMKVLLRNKKRKKGTPKFDPKPYTICELQGRQAVLTRGNTKLRRETQKFKRFYTKDETERGTSYGQSKTDTDGWEEGASVHKGKTALTRQTALAEASHLADAATATVDVQTIEPANADTNTADMQTRQQAAPDSGPTLCPEAHSRRGTRTRNPPSRYGTWVEK